LPPIVAAVDIDRPASDVFAYVTDPAHFTEWQENVVSGNVNADEPVRVGSKCFTTRRVGGAERSSTSEVTELRAPETWATQGIDGPVRATVQVRVEPLENERSRVTISLNFQGFGIGKLLVPLVVRRQARLESPRNMQRLRHRLEEPS
jgi:uncharacterized protein YndB with AHSA1/START domain